ncbi:MAG TPA: hypothetical protein VIG99_21820 [Myxococcaceae bacterium]|jgi:hypothetical protein
MAWPRADSVKIWTLNLAGDLIAGAEISRVAHVFKLEGNAPFLDCTFGERGSKGFHRLMNEGKDFGGDPTDEYFVPIPVKCIGGRYRQARTLGGEAGLLLEGIVESYPAFFKDDDTLRRYWSDQEGPLGTVRMSTPLLAGYYDLLPKGANNVLVGYSQGGLVARYLAFLDEYVFGEGRIAGVITLHSPNHGSPLAHATKTEAIKNGLMDALLWLLRIDPGRFGGTRRYLESVPFSAFWELLHTLYQDLQKQVTAGTLSEEDARFRGVRSALKWLSGLRPLEFPTAFGDLGASNYWNPFSVLSLIHRFPLRRIVSGAVVGTNGQLGPMAASMLGNLVGGLAMSTLNRFSLDSAAQAYAEQVMQDDWASLPAQAMFLKRYLAEYVSGDGQKIPGMAHDFVVPAVSQVLDHDLRSVGTLVNPEANHLSGSSRSRAGHGNAAGDANFNLLLQLLLRMKERLKNGS